MPTFSVAHRIISPIQQATVDADTRDHAISFLASSIPTDGTEINIMNAVEVADDGTKRGEGSQFDTATRALQPPEDKHTSKSK